MGFYPKRYKGYKVINFVTNFHAFEIRSISSRRILNGRWGGKFTQRQDQEERLFVSSLGKVDGSEGKFSGSDDVQPVLQTGDIREGRENSIRRRLALICAQNWLLITPHGPIIAIRVPDQSRLARSFTEQDSLQCPRPCAPPSRDGLPHWDGRLPWNLRLKTL